MKKLLFFLFIFWTYNISAQTTIDDGEMVSGSWTKAGSPYLIAGNIMVPQGETLTIEPGVQVNFLGSYKLLVTGRLLAVGNATDSIVFSPASNAVGWQGIHFEYANNTDSSFIKFCKIENALTFEGNGAGISIISSLKIAVSNCSINHCSSMGFGSAVYSTDSDPLITYNNISYNHSLAGAIFLNNGGVIDNNYISYNDNNYNTGPDPSPGLDPDNYGAGIVDYGSIWPNQYIQSEISNNIITHNTSGYRGGGITVRGDIKVINNTITFNSANAEGGGIFCYDCNNILYNTISNNSATTGAGINIFTNYEVFHDITYVDSNVIYNNSATDGGAGLAISNGWQIYVTRNWICNNNVTAQTTGSQGGGGILITKSIANDPQYNDNLLFKDNIISNNNSLIGAGLSIKGLNALAFANNTITNNASGSKGGGIYFNSSSPDFFSNIIWGNTAVATNGGNQIYLLNEASDPNFYNNDIQGGSSGFGKNGTFFLGKYLNNINTNPGFINPTLSSGNAFNGLLANWALNDTSKCINNGFLGQLLIQGIYTTMYPFPEERDIVGNPREVSCKTDMGAIENQIYIAPPSSVGFNISDYPAYVFNDSIVNCHNPESLTADPYVSASVPKSYYWSTGDTTRSIIVTENGIYKARITLANGCSISDSTYVIIKPIPNFTINKDTQCLAGNNFTYNIAEKLDTANYIYNWSFGDGKSSNSISNNVSHAYSTTGTFEVKLNIVARGSFQCGNSLIKTIVVSGGSFNPFTDTLKICSDTTVLNAGAGYSSYLWNTGSANQKITVNTDGWYKATVINSFGCTIEDSSFISLKPKAIFTINKDTQCLKTNYFIFTNSSIKGAGSITSKIYFGDGTSDTVNTTVAHVYNTAGSFTVKLVVTKDNGCKDSVSRSVLVSGGVYNPFADTLKICSDSTVLDAAIGYVGYLWNNDAITRKITVKSDGWYKVTVDNGLGCTMQDSCFITLKSKAVFTANKDTQCLKTNYFVFTNNSIAGLGTLTSRIYFGDGSSDTINTTVSHVYNSSGNFTVKLVVTKDNGCKDSVNRSIVISGGVYNPFADTLKVCSDTTVLNAGTGYSSYLWNTGSTTSKLTARSDGWYKVTVTNSVGCTNEDSSFILLKPKAILAINKDTQCLKTNYFVFTNNSTGGIGTTIAKIYFGDGTNDTVSTTVSHIYNTGGSFSVKLVVTKDNGCKDSTTKIIRVEQIVFNPLTDSTILIADSLILNAGSGYSSYAWSNGSTSQSIVVKNNGWYKITITNGNGCTASDSSYIILKKRKTLYIDKSENNCSNSSNVSVSVRTLNFTNIVGLQGTILWNAVYLKFKNIVYNNSDINISSTDLNLTQTNSGYLTLSWLDNTLQGKTTADSTQLFTLNFDILSGSTSGLQIPVTFGSSPTLLEIDTVNLATGSLVKTPETKYVNGYIQIAATPKIIYVSLEACDSLIYKGITYIHSSTLVDTLRYVQGCDSVYKNISILIDTAAITPSVFITSSTGAIQYGTSVRFTATTVKGGSTPLYQWYKNGVAINGATDSAYTTAMLNANDTIQVSLTSSFTCAVPAVVVSNKVLVDVFYTVSGKVTNVSGNTIPNTTLNIDNITSIVSSQTFSRSLQGGKKHIIRFSKNNDVYKTNGVSTLDIALIQSHILNITPFNDPFKLLAADVDNNGEISALDILHIRRLILGTATTFPNNRLWSFFDSVKINRENPYPVKDSFLLDSLRSNQSNLLFTGVKLGDVNFDWNPLQSRPAPLTTTPLTIYHDDIWADKNNEVRIQLKVKDFTKLLAMQYTLNFNAQKLTFNRIENNVLGLQYSTAHVSEGNIPFIWNEPKNNPVSISDGNILMDIVFTTQKDLKEEALSINSDIASVEAWDGNFEKHYVKMGSGKIIGTPVSIADKETWSVSPNPSHGNVILTVLSADNKEVVFILRNASGKTIKSYPVKLICGSNSIKLNLRQTGHIASGIYFITATGIADEISRKLIIE